MNHDLKKGCMLLLAYSLILLLGSFLATQLTAIQFQFDSLLGDPIIHCLRLYSPLDFWRWTLQFNDIPRFAGNFRFGWLCIMGSICISLLYSGRNVFLKSFKKAEIKAYGSAHFATQKEIKESGLLCCSNEEAVYVGAFKDEKKEVIHYLRDGSNTHVFVFAPSRSGKGVGLIIPTLLSYSSSVIISDFKLENWFLTAGYRKLIGQVVLKFDPTCTDGSTARFNPLFEIRKGDNEVRDAQLIADMLVDPEGKGANDHWSNAANSLLVSTILHVLYEEDDKSLAGVRNFLSDPERTEEETLEKMLSGSHPVISSGAREMLNKTEGERASVISSALTFLKLYRDPIVAQNICGHDFTINDLVFHEKPVSLYLGIPPSDIGRMMPFMRLMLQMILSRLTETLEINSPRRQLLLMLDEFPQFGRLPFFEKVLSYSAGYNIRAYLISQDMQQIYKEYGRDQSIVSNCGIRIAYAPNTLETARYLSESLGSMTLKQKHVNYSGRRFEWMLNNMSVSENDIKRSLLTPDELTRLPADEALIFKNGISPIYGKKIFYYSDATFNAHAKISAPITSDRLIERIPQENINDVKPKFDADPANNPFNWLHQSLSSDGEE